MRLPWRNLSRHAENQGSFSSCSWNSVPTSTALPVTMAYPGETLSPVETHCPVSSQGFETPTELSLSSFLLVNLRLGAKIVIWHFYPDFSPLYELYRFECVWYGLLLGKKTFAKTSAPDYWKNHPWNPSSPDFKGSSVLKGDLFIWGEMGPVPLDFCRCLFIYMAVFLVFESWRMG